MSSTMAGIRDYLLHDENFSCPGCHTDDVSPDSLVPNKAIRETIKIFRANPAQALLQLTATAPVADHSPIMEPGPEREHRCVAWHTRDTPPTVWVGVYSNLRASHPDLAASRHMTTRAMR